MLSSKKDGNFKFSAKGRDLALFIGNGTKVKTTPESKPPLGYNILVYLLAMYEGWLGLI